MQLLKDYVLLTEIVDFSKMSKSSIYRRYNNKFSIGKLSLIKKNELHAEDKNNLLNFTDLTMLYPMGELSKLLGRDRDHLSHMMNPSKASKLKPKPIKLKKIGGKYNMIILTKPFMENIIKGLTPFLINTNTERDYENEYKDYDIIDFYNMKVGFY